jgi:hypothetical protein
METNTTPIPTIPSIEAGLQLLASSLVLATRADGTEYRMLREDCPMYEDLRAIIQDAHNGELPNDWRFGMVYDLAHALLDYSQPQACAVTVDEFRECIGDIVATQGDTSTYALLVWLSDNVARCHFDDAEAWCSCEDGSDIGALAHHRQMEEIEWITHAILSGLDALVSA